MMKAVEAGILEKPDVQHGRANYPHELAGDYYHGKVMTAEKFKDAIGGVEEKENEDDGTVQLLAKDMDKFREVIEQL